MNDTSITQKTQQSIAAALELEGMNIIAPGRAAMSDVFCSQILREVFFVEHADFVGDALEHLAGATAANTGYFAVGGLVACLHDTMGRQGAETGWHRWRLPSVDGVARANDRTAPSVLLAPNGAILWRKSDTKAAHRVTLAELIERAVEHYDCTATGEGVAA